MRGCPACGHEKAYFIGDICGDCHARGQDLAPANPDPGGPPENTKGGKRIMEKRPCAKRCGKMLDPRGAHKHEAICTGPSSAAEARARVGRKPRMQKPKSIRRARRHDGLARAPASPAKADPCFFCAGTNSALAKDLVIRMIRGGMGFDAAAELAREVVGAIEAPA